MSGMYSTLSFSSYNEISFANKSMAVALSNFFIPLFPGRWFRLHKILCRDICLLPNVLNFSGIPVHRLLLF